jgi:hypothetical protein
MNCTRAIILFGLLAAWAAGAEHDTTSAGRGRPWERYEILVERNIFSRSRGGPRAGDEEPAERPAPRPEEFVYLRGVVCLDGRALAVVEDMRSGRIRRLRAGDALLRGAVGRVGLRGMEYVRDADSVMIAVGDNLARSASPAPASGAEQAGAPPAADEAPGGAGDILERLRQRRLRELGQ